MNDLILEMVKFQLQVKVLHWHTIRFSRHLAFGGLYDDLDDLIDEFAETYMGKYGRNYFGDASIDIVDGKKATLQSTLDNFITFLSDEVSNKLEEKDTDLLNIRDSILGKVNKLKYLLTLS